VKHELSSVYIYRNGICLLHRESLKSVGLSSLVATHLASHITSDSNFDDADTLFKRAFYKSITLLNHDIPQLKSKNINFDENEKEIRKEEFKHKLRSLPLNFNHLKRDAETSEELDANLNNMITASISAEHDNQFQQEQTEMTSIVKIPNDSTADKNDLVDDLFDQLMHALEAKDEDKILELQKQIDMIELDPVQD